jgi:AcrR family transcriptional regulator
MNATATVSTKVRDKRRQRRADILDAAMHSFREEGYHETTLDDIAGRLGIQKTALYYYFPDKAALLYECHRVSLRELDGVLASTRKMGDSARERLGFLIREHIRVMTETLEGSPSAFEVSALHPLHQRDIIAGRDCYERGLRELVGEGIDRGEFRAVDVKTVVFAILGSVNWIARWYKPGGPMNAAALGEQFADYLVGGLICQP